MKNISLIKRYGTKWARNSANIARLKQLEKESGETIQGVYFLFDGSMPVYVGKGHIRRRVRSHKNSKWLRDLWDRFSWYQARRPEMMHDLEVIALRLLPPNLRFLTRQEGHFVEHNREKEVDENAEIITRKLPPKKIRKKK